MLRRCVMFPMSRKIFIVGPPPSDPGSTALCASVGPPQQRLCPSVSPLSTAHCPCVWPPATTPLPAPRIPAGPGSAFSHGSRKHAALTRAERRQGAPSCLSACFVFARGAFMVHQRQLCAPREENLLPRQGREGAVRGSVGRCQHGSGRGPAAHGLPLGASAGRPVAHAAQLCLGCRVLAGRVRGAPPLCALGQFWDPTSPSLLPPRLHSLLTGLGLARLSTMQVQ